MAASHRKSTQSKQLLVPPGLLPTPAAPSRSSSRSSRQSSAANDDSPAALEPGISAQPRARKIAEGADANSVAPLSPSPSLPASSHTLSSSLRQIPEQSDQCRDASGKDAFDSSAPQKAAVDFPKPSRHDSLPRAKALQKAVPSTEAESEPGHVPAEPQVSRPIFAEQSPFGLPPDPLLQEPVLYRLLPPDPSEIYVRRAREAAAAASSEAPTRHFAGPGEAGDLAEYKSSVVDHGDTVGAAGTSGVVGETVEEEGAQFSAADPAKPLLDYAMPLDQLRAQVRASADPNMVFEYVQHLGHLADSMPRDMRARAHAEALKNLKKVADTLPAALVLLAECYGSGMLSLQIDSAKAFNYYVRASKAGHAAAAYRTAVCFESGTGVRRSPAQAVTFFRRAANLAYPPALYRLGCIMLRGELGVAPVPLEALQLLLRAAESADESLPHPLHELAMLYEHGHSDDASGGASDLSQASSKVIPPDSALAVSYYTRAALLGYAPSQLRLGQCFRDCALDCPQDPKASIMWFTRAAEQGDPDAELALSGWYYEGAGGILAPNHEQAYAWAHRAALKGLPYAELAMGYYFERGISVAADYNEARIWYQRAAEQGLREAMMRLEELELMQRLPEYKKRGNSSARAGECQIV